MAQNVTLYNLLISCPGDVKKEINLIESAVNEFNELYTEYLGITIKTCYWGKSSYAQSGGKPQSLLNEQFVNKCDAAVAIFWTRFGSPTDEYGSGTEEEIENMIKSKKQVFMYFSDKSIPPSKINNDEYKKIVAFRDKYKDKGLYFTFSSDKEFRKMFFSHLSMYFLATKKVKETEKKYFSKLKLLGIDERGKLSTTGITHPFTFENITTDGYIDLIKSLFQEISNINVGKRTSRNNHDFLIPRRPIDIDENEKKYILFVAKQLEYEISDSFFELGNLNENLLSSTPFFDSRLVGTSKEKQKYNKIKKLCETIYNMLKWVGIEKAFSGMKCIKLAVQNCGKTIDEDVEITLEFPKKCLINLNEFPELNNEQKEYLLNECNMTSLFGIDSTKDYIGYLESEGNKIFNKPSLISFPEDVLECNDNYMDELQDVFCYTIYSNDENYIIKLKVDYIKHNTTVAFPTIIFVKNNSFKIPYRITSKNNPDIIRDTLIVKN